MALLEVSDIDVFYGPIQALRGVSLTVEEGEMVALVGANGAGKTTTLRTISGLLAPTKGEILFDGKPIHGLAAQEVTTRGIAHLPEGRDLFAALPVDENLKLGYWTRRKNKAGLQPQMDRVMDHFPILRQRAKQAAGTLSGGEQQMLGVARALMSSPRLLVVDELSLGLAPIIVAQLFDILEEVNKEGTSVLLVEQFVHLALEHTKRAYVLQKGEVVIAGISADLANDPSLVASYLGDEAGAEASTPIIEEPVSDSSAARPAFLGSLEGKTPSKTRSSSARSSARRAAPAAVKKAASRKLEVAQKATAAKKAVSTSRTPTARKKAAPPPSKNNAS